MSLPRATGLAWRNPLGLAQWKAQSGLALICPARTTLLESYGATGFSVCLTVPESR
jgi:hypothetical protein